MNSADDRRNCPRLLETDMAIAREVLKFSSIDREETEIRALFHEKEVSAVRVWTLGQS